MSINRFKPQIWSAKLLVALRNQLVYGGPQVVNHDYEGEIANAGDTVRITSIGRPSVKDYVPGVTKIDPEQLTDAQRTLVVDQAKFFAFEVDDVDARQAAGNVMPQAADESAYALADVIDQYIAQMYIDAALKNVLGSSSDPIVINPETNPKDAYNKVLVPLRTALAKANVPTQGRYLIAPPEFTGALLQDDRFIKVNESGDNGDALRNGHIGRAAGFDLYESNNAPIPTTGVAALSAGTNRAISLAEQINKVEAYRPQDSFSDALKGLLVFGGKVVQPDALAAAYVAVS
ncbi:P22 phage major capsid protein family protein [Curtobacterium sp. 22159]|uniref:P22 phage major capsid protein family protein n=1 Tax=Curtobacterium sp. 22159 TaxID=3453882 RepID=UPI003F87456F